MASVQFPGFYFSLLHGVARNDAIVQHFRELRSADCPLRLTQTPVGIGLLLGETSGLTSAERRHESLIVRSIDRGLFAMPAAAADAYSPVTPDAEAVT